MEKTEGNNLPELTKSITHYLRGWFQSLFFWPTEKEVLEITAKQKIPEGLEEFALSVAVAEIVIKKNGKVVFTDEIPWGMPVVPGTDAQCLLLMQVYILSQQPKYQYPEWQKIMEKFCWSFPDFKPPDKLWWGEQALDL